MEENRTKLSITDYAVSTTSLEQIFIGFAQEPHVSSALTITPTKTITSQKTTTTTIIDSNLSPTNQSLINYNYNYNYNNNNNSNNNNNKIVQYSSNAEIIESNNIPNVNADDNDEERRNGSSRTETYSIRRHLYI